MGATLVLKHQLTQVVCRINAVAMILVGLIAAFYGPYELFVIYLFSEGGRFYYKGFGYGSLWFAALLLQIIAYYGIAAVLLPLGFGHLKFRRWALTLTQLFLWFWLGAGILIGVNGILLMPTLLRDGLHQVFPYLQWPEIIVASLISCLILPALGLWFYKSRWVKGVFSEHDSEIYWTEKYPIPLMATLVLFFLMIIVMHFAIILQGVFPVFGQINLMRDSAPIIAGCILVLVGLIYGTVKLKPWAWWVSLVFVTLLTISTFMSFSKYNLSEITQMMHLPAAEIAYFEKLPPLHHVYLTGLLVVPLLVALGLILYSKRYFRKENDPSS